VIQRWVDFSEDYLPVTTLAVCKYNNTKSSIVINTYSWSSLSEVEKEIVIYHELGHCVLGLKHDNTKVDHDWVLSSPLSIMYPYVLEQDWYLKNKKEYLDELFSRNRYEIFEEAQ
jgi:ATP-dependent Zn protease